MRKPCIWRRWEHRRRRYIRHMERRRHFKYRWNRHVGFVHLRGDRANNKQQKKTAATTTTAAATTATTTTTNDKRQTTNSTAQATSNQQRAADNNNHNNSSSSSNSDSKHDCPKLLHVVLTEHHLAFTVSLSYLPPFPQSARVRTITLEMESSGSVLSACPSLGPIDWL